MRKLTDAAGNLSRKLQLIESIIPRQRGRRTSVIHVKTSPLFPASDGARRASILPLSMTDVQHLLLLFLDADKQVFASAIFRQSSMKATIARTLKHILVYLRKMKDPTHSEFTLRYTDTSDGVWKQMVLVLELGGFVAMRLTGQMRHGTKFD